MQSVILLSHTPLLTGLEISSARYRKLLEWSQDPLKNNAEKKFIAYIADSGRKNVLINANPRFLPHNGAGGNGLWIGGLVNENSPGEPANCLLVKRKLADDGKFWPVLLTIRDIAPGTLSLLALPSSFLGPIACMQARSC